MERIPPGPFNGLFDAIDYDSGAFFPITTTITLLLFTWVAMLWALLRRRKRVAAIKPGGFPIKPVQWHEVDD